MKLRSYQERTIQQSRQALATHNRVIACLPTGAGKTVIFSEIIRMAYERGRRVVVLMDRLQLIEQAAGKLGIPYGRIQGGRTQIDAPVQLASVDTLRRRELPPCDLLIIDECHESKFDKIVQKFNCKTIGFTATPFRKGSQPSLHLTYQKIIEPVTILDLISDGYLCPAVTYGVKLDRSDIKIKGNDYDQSDMFDKFNNRELYGGLINNYLKLAPGKKSICFCVNVEHSKLTAEAFKAVGIPAAHLDGSSNKTERDRVLADFKAGRIMVLCNCALYTKGFDEPSIECVILNRATTSLPLYLQMCGRGSRLFGDKSEFTVIDQGGNTHELGLWEQPREWTLEKKRKKKGDGVAPVKECKKCGALVHSTAKNCKYCGFIFPVAKKILQEKELNRIEAVEIPERLKKPFKTMTRQELTEYAKLKRYKMGWVYNQIKLRDAYN